MRMGMKMGMKMTSPEDLKLRESIDHRLAELLKSAELAGFGQDAFVFRVAAGRIPEELVAKLRELGELSEVPDDVAMKMLKIYEPGMADRELAMQQRMNKLLKPHAGDRSYAQVPRVYFVHTVQFSKDEHAALLAMGIKVPERADLILMDFVPGRDFKQVLAAEVMQRSEGATPDQIQRTTEASSDFVYEFLRKRGFVVHSSVAGRLEKTMRLGHENRVYHRDLHEANVMIEGDPRTPDCTVSIIDFGRARETPRDEHDEQKPVDEFMVARRIRAHQGEREGVDEDELSYRDDLERLSRLVAEGDPRWGQVRIPFVSDPVRTLGHMNATNERELSQIAFGLLGALHERLISAADAGAALDRIVKSSRQQPMKKKLRWLKRYLMES